MSIPSPKICRGIRSRFGQMGSSNENIAKTAREKLIKLLADHGLTLNDIAACIAAADEDDRVRAGKARHQQQQSHGSPSATTDPQVNILNLVLDLIEMNIAITPEERMAVALWILHTHVFDRFGVTPRLALLSPVRGCGKTTLQVLLELLTADADRNTNVTAASLYYDLDRGAKTLLLDEADNLGLLHNPVLRTVLNSNRRGDSIKRYIAGRARKLPTFAPLAVAAIGMLPLPLLHRSVIVMMQRASTPMTLLDEYSPVFPAARAEIRKWAESCKLASDPKMPPSLRNRAVDNWRVLLAIADDLGRGDEARAAAVALCANRPDEDAGVVLLTDIRNIFLSSDIDRIASATLIEALRNLDDGMWADWRGPNDDRPPRKLNQADMARLLRPFGIRPRTIWPLQRRPDSKSARGYLREQFKPAWDAYCPPADTPTQPSKIIHLPTSRSNT